MGIVHRQLQQMIQLHQVRITSQNLIDYQHLNQVILPSSFDLHFDHQVYLSLQRTDIHHNFEPFEGWQLKVQVDKVDRGHLKVNLKTAVSVEQALTDKEDCLWRVIRKGIYDSVDLEVGDILKIGRHKLLISSLITSRYQFEPNPDFEEEGATCRICYETTGDLLDICNCTGSMKYIHRNCLKEWVVNQVRQNVAPGPNKTKTVAYSSTCEICGHFFRLNPRMFIDNDQQDLTYLVLEYWKGKKSFVVVTPAEKVVIGRNTESSFIIKDISISRSHCSIFYNKSTGELRLKDHGSKFGTLKLLKSQAKLQGMQHWLHKQNYLMKIKQSCQLNCQPCCEDIDQ